MHRHRVLDRLRIPTRHRHRNRHAGGPTVTEHALVAGGTLAYLGLEWGNPATMAGMSPGDRILNSLFLSVMSRSGGFSTIAIDQLDGSSLLVTDMLMFVGGGSASTAGGIKVTTLAILFLAAFA